MTRQPTRPWPGCPLRLLQRVSFPSVPVTCSSLPSEKHFEQSDFSTNLLKSISSLLSSTSKLHYQAPKLLPCLNFHDTVTHFMVSKSALMCKSAYQTTTDSSSNQWTSLSPSLEAGSPRSGYQQMAPSEAEGAATLSPTSPGSAGHPQLSLVCPCISQTALVFMWHPPGSSSQFLSVYISPFQRTPIISS